MTYNNNNITSFVVFKYDFCKTRNLSKVEGTLPLEFSGIPSSEHYLECQNGFERVMDSLLESKKMTLVESKKNADAIIHDNRILGFREGVAVLDVCADKKEFYWSNFTENEIHNQPFCKVIIDNRPNKGFLFVEESTIFGGKRGQDNVVALLRDNINRVANQYGWNMVISAKLPPGDFFDAVAERIRLAISQRLWCFHFLAIRLLAMRHIPLSGNSRCSIPSWSASMHVSFMPDMKLILVSSCAWTRQTETLPCW